MKRLYFTADDEQFCYSKEYLLLFMEEKGLDEMEIFPAIKYKEPGYFYCKLLEMFGEKGNDFFNCGTSCEFYTPRNGKSGCCVHYSTTFHEPAEEPIVLRRNRKV